MAVPSSMQTQGSPLRGVGFQPAIKHEGSPLRLALRCTAFALAAVYIGWNLYGLMMLQIPQSLLLAISGIPCPTTGCTRAIIALSQGDWQQSLRMNPLAVPLTLLACCTVGRLAVERVLSKRFRLHQRWLHVWLALLAIAWVVKLGWA